MITRLESLDRGGRWSLPDLLSSGAGHDVVALFDLTTSGRSMYPAIRQGDRVALAPLQKPVPGDIVVFRQGDQLICHRIVAIGDGCLHVRGDAAGPDAPCDRVPLDLVIGRVTAIDRRGSRFSPPSTARGAAVALRQKLLTLAVRVARHSWWRGACARFVARRVTLSDATRKLGQPGRVRVARLGGRCVGTLDLTSGECWIHPRLCGFGIEDILSNGEPR